MVHSKYSMWSHGSLLTSQSAVSVETRSQGARVTASGPGPFPPGHMERVVLSIPTPTVAADYHLKPVRLHVRFRTGKAAQITHIMVNDGEAQIIEFVRVWLESDNYVTKDLEIPNGGAIKSGIAVTYLLTMQGNQDNDAWVEFIGAGIDFEPIHI